MCQISDELLNKKEEIHELTGKYLTKQIYFRSLYALGLINRTLSNIDAYIQLHKSDNLIAAFSMIRLQLDSVLRLYALEIVEDAESVCSDVFLNGSHIRKMKDKDGELMTDYYLHTKLNENVINLSKVYSNFSSYIHFSDTHILTIFENMERVKTGDYHSSFNEDYIVNCDLNMKAITDIFIILLKRQLSTIP